MREEFEKWAVANHPNIDLLGGDFEGIDLTEFLHVAWSSYQAGFRAGAMEMRERAAKVCDKFADESSNPMNFSENCAKVIRKLPVEE